MGASQRGELSWTAFRYVSGEMSVAEAETFEQRLAGDQAAREAVARSVQITQAVTTAPAGPVFAPSSGSGDSVRGSWKRALAWTIGTCAAVCLAFVIGLRFQPRGLPHNAANEPIRTARRPAEGGVLHPDAEGARRLVSLWSLSDAMVSALVEPAANDTMGDGASAGTATSSPIAAWEDGAWDETEFGLTDNPGAEPVEFTVPNWMLAAVSIPADMPEERPGLDAPVQEN